MNFEFLFNPFKLNKTLQSKQSLNLNDIKNEVDEIDDAFTGSGLYKRAMKLPIDIKKFQPIRMKPLKGGSLKKSNNIQMIY